MQLFLIINFYLWLILLLFLLVLKDDLSHLVELIPTVTAEAKEAVDACLKWFSRFGIPDVIITDQGTHFKNQLVARLTTLMGIEHHFTTAYCPWSNGTIERMNREIIRLLRALRSEYRIPTPQWICLVPLVQYVLNTNKFDSLAGMSPIQVVTGRVPASPLALVFRSGKRVRQVVVGRVAVEDIRERTNELQAALVEIHKKVDSERLKKHLQNKRDQGEVQLPRLALGDFVLVARKVPSRPSKLHVVWRGPFKVVGTKNDRVYIIAALDQQQQRTEEVHVRRLRRYTERMINVTEDLQQQVNFDDESFNVDCFLGYRRVRDERDFLIQVRWIGFNEAWDTWEPIGQLKADVPQLVQRYVQDHVEETPALRRWLC